MKKSIAMALGTFFGIGFLPGAPGTYGSLAAILVIYLIQPGTLWLGIMLIFAIVAGIWCGSVVESGGRKDPSEFVLDEVAGQWLTFIFLPYSAAILISGFALFRFFDILKPSPINQSQRLPGGSGIMADDILAGIFSNIILQILLYFHII